VGWDEWNWDGMMCLSEFGNGSGDGKGGEGSEGIKVRE